MTPKKKTDADILLMLENVEYPFIAIARKPTLAWSSSAWQGPIYG